MKKYIPDYWVIVEITSSNDKVRKVFASWYGGFINGDSWRLSSGITEILDINDEYYEIHNESGSVYICNKNRYGMSLYAESVYADLIRKKSEDIEFFILDEEKIYDS